MRSYLEAWLLKAEHDLISAYRLIEIEPAMTDTACFHCQQAMEKSLKAYLIYKGEDIEKTHDIIYLLSRCQSFDEAFRNIDPNDIDVYAVQGRYPDFRGMPNIVEAKNHYATAIEINEMVKARINLTL